MSDTVAKNRFIVSSKYAALYQQLVTISDFHRLGKWLVDECEKAQAFRQAEKLKELSLVLSGIPIQEYQLIGQFYQSWQSARKGQRPRKLLEDVIEKSSTFKSKALIALAALEMQDGDYSSASKLCTEAIRQSQIPTVILHSARSIAILKGIEGFHNKALKDLETIGPLARYASPVARYQYLNSLAVEYSEIGRIEQAANVSKIVLASPYAFAYPEWRETGAEIARRGYKSRSSVRITQSFLEPKNLLRLPAPEPSPVSDTPIKSRRARVLNYLDWKKKMGKNGEDKIDTQKMSERELLLKIIELSSNEDITEWELRQILDAIIKITSKRG
jgi:hypothetical protein